MITRRFLRFAGGCLAAAIGAATTFSGCGNFTGKDAAGDYMVIDLSGGPPAASYPVAYLAALPNPITDEYKTTKLVLRKIPAGSFTMGSPTDELGRESNETQHQVTLTKEFYIGVFEVTQKQWELVMGSKPSDFFAGMWEKRPVEEVSYVDAGSFMATLRQKTGLSTFDLPTEAQWEYACRAGTTTALNSGTNLASTGRDTNMSLLGRYYYNGGSSYSSYPATGGTASVGSYLPNTWGLYDMHGNVWEWCADWYGIISTTAVSDPTGAASGRYRVLRGSGWDFGAASCRSASRSSHFPDYSTSNYGFRLLRTVPYSK